MLWLIPVLLQDGWRIQDSNLVSVDGAAVSATAFDDHTWTPATVPSTVLGNLVPPTTGTGSTDDPFFGDNLLKLPGSDSSYYPIGKNYGEVETPKESPFGRGWWYRREFTVSAIQPGQHVDLDFAGITYGAEIWLNGKQLAASSDTKGTYRAFNYDVTSVVNTDGKANTLAVLVNPPVPSDLTPSWVDWNPTPQDKNMGLWREVTLSVHGSVRVDHPFVTSEIDLPQATRADLALEADLVNTDNQPVHGSLHGKVGDIEFDQPISLAAGERRTVRFSPKDIPALAIKNPKLWWPWQMGEPNLYHMALEFVLDDHGVSDKKEFDFGIRKIDSSVTDADSRLFTINGKPILIRGGGWASDLFLRFSKEREAQELKYVRDLGLNTVRLEGRFEPQSFLDLTDRMGILVMPGWVCCNAWQFSIDWDQEHFDIAAASIRDQIYEYRGHASTLTFLYGSDEAPLAKIEKIYVDALKQYDWPNPVVASATKTDTPLNGKSGFKMNGPYEYTPPSYWYVDDSNGGAFGFNTETSPGPSMPPIESILKFIPTDHMSSIDDMWMFHTGENQFHNLDILKDAVQRRFGTSADDVGDFIEKTQLMSYDNHRAMFEAFGRNKYHNATGLIQWMLNNAWPSFIWHLWDFEMRPDAAYYGVKKADVSLHVQYSYDDQSIVVVNSTYEPASNLHVVAQTLDLSANVLERQEATVSVDADGVQSAFKMQIPSGSKGRTYFLKLDLLNGSAVIDSNFYWLSNKAEVYDWGSTDFRLTPVTQEADLSALSELPQTQISAHMNWDAGKKSGSVTIENTGKSIALFVRLKLMQNGEEILPVYWSDNYVSLLPGEVRVVGVNAPDAQSPRIFEGNKVSLEGSSWNVSGFSAQ